MSSMGSRMGSPLVSCLSFTIIATSYRSITKEILIGDECYLENFRDIFFAVSNVSKILGVLN